MTDHYLLFRASLAEEEELAIARKHFWCMESRAELAHECGYENGTKTTTVGAPAYSVKQNTPTGGSKIVRQIIPATNKVSYRNAEGKLISREAWYQLRVEEAVAAEREACAKLCDEVSEDYCDSVAWVLESRAELAALHHSGYPRCVVIPRYAALPFYKELEDDVLLLNGKLINSYREHQYVADLQNWYGDLEKLTPRTWFRLEDALASGEKGPFVLKGATNSKKHAWKTHMFAETRDDIVRVACNLMDDTFISQQPIYVREFEEFESFGLGVMGLPVTNEWRFFILDGEIMAYGFYWSEHVDWLEARGVDFEELCAGAQTFVTDHVIPVVKGKIRFWVVDIGLRARGGWRVIELNDGQMSGLSCVDPDKLYANMAAHLGDKYDRSRAH